MDQIFLKILPSFSFFQRRSSVIQRIAITLFLLFIFRLGNLLPLTGIDQEALQQLSINLQKNNSIFQLLNLYSSGGVTKITFFSLGILPYINASMVVDLLVNFIPSLEQLQTEEGESGRQTILFYKKIVTFFVSIFQTVLLLSSIQAYFFYPNWISYLVAGSSLITGALVTVWLTSLIDKQGLGNGSSLFIFFNIIISFFGHVSFSPSFSFNSSFIVEITFFLILCLTLCWWQQARFEIPVISSRQLVLQQKKETNIKLKIEKEEQGSLSIRMSQAGIFPLLLASNFFSLFAPFFKEQNSFKTIIYYFLVLFFNYLYTSIFWEPKKISDQLLKSSVCISNISPGIETTKYLENVVFATALLGGSSLCLFLFLFNFVQTQIQTVLLNQLNISSLIILLGISFEIYQSIRLFSLKQN